ncbi:MAG: hypothetical protein HKO65_01405, partial [Gemmatimonadetes bacterium]|nr:hypothetical protein [Gemmatimonadota bacterium]
TIHLFRSEEHVRRWCGQRSLEPGEIVPLGQCWELAKRWYEGREELGWVRESPYEVLEVFRGVGLHGPFWEFE